MPYIMYDILKTSVFRKLCEGPSTFSERETWSESASGNGAN